MLYGGNNNWFAAYAYWYFKLYGHDDVRLLDGGRKKWELDGRELTDKPTERDRTSYTAKEQDHSIRAFRDEVVGGHRHARTWSTSAAPTSSPAACSPRRTCRRSRRSAPVTSRPPATCRGARPPTTTAPSAADDELRQLYAEAGLDEAKDTIAYCRIGERSSHTWFVLHELLGQENVKNYDGSWTEYGSLVGVPIALGDEPGEA